MYGKIETGSNPDCEIKEKTLHIYKSIEELKWAKRRQAKLWDRFLINPEMSINMYEREYELCSTYDPNKVGYELVTKDNLEASFAWTDDEGSRFMRRKLREADAASEVIKQYGLGPDFVRIQQCRYRCGDALGLDYQVVIAGLADVSWMTHERYVLIVNAVENAINQANGYKG